MVATESGQLQALAPLDHPEAKFDAWKRDPTKFPHFTAFVGFWIYSFYDAEKIRICLSIATGRAMRSNYAS
jgi:hypothetical protein